MLDILAAKSTNVLFSVIFLLYLEMEIWWNVESSLLRSESSNRMRLQGEYEIISRLSS